MKKYGNADSTFSFPGSTVKPRRNEPLHKKGWATPRKLGRTGREKFI
jgi:hypothetical protein